MSDSGFVVLRTFLNHFEADLAKTALDAAGIASFIRSDDCGGMRPHLWMAGIEILIDPNDLAQAEDVLGSEGNPNGSTIWEAPPDTTEEEDANDIDKKGSGTDGNLD